MRRGAGEQVYAGTVLREGKFLVRAERVGNETAAARIVQFVEAAPIGETRIQNYAEKFADRLVAPQLAPGCGLFAVTGNVNRFLSMAIIDYGTGMRVAAPTAVMASIAHAARQGIVIRSGSHVEKLAGADTVVFDKTGTLTTGCPEVGNVVPYRRGSFRSRRCWRWPPRRKRVCTNPWLTPSRRKPTSCGFPFRSVRTGIYEIGMGVSAQVNG